MNQERWRSDLIAADYAHIDPLEKQRYVNLLNIRIRKYKCLEKIISTSGLLSRFQEYWVAVNQGEIKHASIIGVFPFVLQPQLAIGLVSTFVNHMRKGRGTNTKV